jgi:hypothetical protein
MASSLREALERVPYNTARWQRLRKEQLRKEPLCAMCLPRCVPATVCDHIEPHKGDLEKFWSGPFQSLCKPCHDSDKQRLERGGKPKSRIQADGWPATPGGYDQTGSASKLERCGSKKSINASPVASVRAHEADHGR